MPDYDFLPVVAAVVVAAVIVGGLCVPLSPATYDGLDHRGESGLVIAGSGEELANASAPEVDDPTADRWHITSGDPPTTEETSDADGLTVKVVLQDVSTTAPLWVWILCAACFVVIGGLAVGIWILVRKEFR